LNLSTGLPPDIYKPRQKPSRFYRVQKGDTAGEIAWIHRVKLSDLILANHLDSRATIYIRQKLRLPVPGEVLDKPAKDKPFKKTGKKAEISRVLNSSANRHRPKSISKIVPKIELSPSKAAPPTLQLPVKPVEREDGLLLDRVMTQQGKRIGIVRVVPEETLGHYAVWLGISTQSIRRLNRFDFGKTIRVNQEVKIPLDEVPKEQFEKKRLGYHKGREKFFFDSYKIENVQTYQIKNGDNIWTLCNEVFEVPFWLIKKYNPGLDFNRLRPLQKVSIPVVAERDHKPGKI
jgi:membrane-bound lytic murein transglycosylase D